MNDELTYLRWFHRNAYRFAESDGYGGSDIELLDAQEAYERETGNKVPNDWYVG